LSVRARRPRGLSRHRRRASRVGERRRKAWREGHARASERSHRRPRDGARLARRVPGRDRRLAHPMTRLGVPLLVGALAGALAAMPALLLTRAVAVDRPELAGFVLVAALLYLLRRGRAGSWRALVACTALVGVWANVHGSFALGAVLTGFVCIEGALRDVARRREYIAVALATLAVTLATPAGIATWTAPGSHFLSPPRDIQEWN